MKTALRICAAASNQIAESPMGRNIVDHQRYTRPNVVSDHVVFVASGGHCAMTARPNDEEPAVIAESLRDAGIELTAAERAYMDGDHDDAARALDRAARAGAAQRALEAAERYAVARAAAGDLNAAFTYLIATLSFPSDPDLPEFQQADLLRVAGELARAQARYEQLTDYQDLAVNLRALSRLARLRYDSGDGPGVLALLGSRLGMILFGRNAPVKALVILRTAAKSGEPTALFTLGRVLLWSDEVEEAREVLTRLAALDSGLGCRALVNVGNTYWEAGDVERAREMYLRALEYGGEPDDVGRANARMLLGYMAKKNRDWPEARRWYQEVLDSGTLQNAMAAAHLGEIAYWLDEHEDAVRNYERTLATGTEHSGLVGEAAYRLGEIHRARGDVEAAKAILRRAIESGDASFSAKAADLLAELGT
jgi:tetratricopeptide (TPR) repeat protein